METNENFRDDRQVRDAERQTRRDHHLSSNRPVIGAILLLIGLFLVLKNTGFFPEFIDDVIFSWPMLLVAIGLIMTLSSSERTSGVIIMAVGGFFLIPMIFRETFHVYNMFWPSIFIIIGITFLVSKRRGWASSVTTGIIGDDFVDYTNIFSGGERQVISQSFKGGRITAVFGGMELDLTKAKLAPGKNELELSCIFGGATLIVPDDWNIIIMVTPILGGFNDSRKLIPGRMIDPDKQLVVKGTVIFGGGEVKSY
jgi:predicted membrane protein